MVRRGSSVSNDAQDFDLAVTLRTLRGNFGLSRLFLFFFLRKGERRQEFQKTKTKNKKKKKNKTSLDAK